MKIIRIALGLWLLCAFPAAAPCAAATIVADHTVVDKYDQIPQRWIDEVKKMLICIPGESHGRGYLYGFELLRQADSRFAAQTTWYGRPPEPTDSHLRVSRVYRTGSSFQSMGGEAAFYTSEGAVERMSAGLRYMRDEARNPVSVMLFGWCWDMTWQNNPGGGVDPVHQVRWAGSSEGGPDGSRRWGLDDGDTDLTGNRVSMQTYIDAVIAYNAAVPETVTVLNTGPVDGNASGESGYQRHLKHQYIRNAASTLPNAALFDYADILNHNDAGQEYRSATGYTDHGGTFHTFPSIHPDNRGNYSGGDGGCHIGRTGCMRLAKAMWWLFARIAGWDGGSGDPDTTPPTTPQRLSGEVVSGPAVSLSWEPSTDAESGVSHYLVYRRQASGWVNLARSNITSYNDTAVQTGQTYSYRVSAVNPGGYESPPSDDIDIFVAPDPQNGPQLSRIKVLHAQRLRLTFDRSLSPVSAEKPANYTINGVTVSGAKVTASTTVEIATSTHEDQANYEIIAKNIADEQGTVTTETRMGYTYERPARAFIAGSHTHNGVTLPYRLYRPEGWQQNQPLPLMLTLHGGGGTGSDNWQHITYDAGVAEAWAEPLRQEAHPCFVLSPQNPVGSWQTYVDLIHDLMDKLIADLPIDTKRLYVSGISWGGLGTFQMLAADPDRFAAAVPMAGSSTAGYVSRAMLPTAVWNFHSRNDGTVPVADSRAMVDAYARLGADFIPTHCDPDGGCADPLTTAELDALVAAKAPYVYTECESCGHACQGFAFAVDQLFDWVFAHSRDSVTPPPPPPPGDNLANATTHTDNSELASPNGAAGLWDGSTAETGEHIIYGNGDPLWVSFDFGKVYDLKRIRLFGDNSNSYRCARYHVAVRETTDHRWRSVVTDSQCDAAQWFEHTLTDVKARYLRLEATGPNNMVEIREFEVFGTSGETPPPVNHPPQWRQIGDQQVQALKTLSFTVHADDDDNDPLTYSAANLPKSASFTASTRQFTWTPPLGAPGCTVSFAVTDGKSAPVTMDVAITVTAPPDPETPGIPGNLQADQITTEQVVLSWQKPTGVVTGYRVFRDAQQLGDTTATTYKDTGVLAGQSYTYRVLAYNDTAQGKPAELPVTIPEQTDTQPPTVPEDLTAAALSRDSIALAWKPASDNVAVTGYNIYCNGSFLKREQGLYFVHKGLASDTEYIYQVTAVDAAENESARTEEVSATTKTQDASTNCFIQTVYCK